MASAIALADVLAEPRVHGPGVAAAEHQVHPAVREVLERAVVLGDAHRVGRRDQRGGRRQDDALGLRGDEGHAWSWAMTRRTAGCGAARRRRRRGRPRRRASRSRPGPRSARARWGCDRSWGRWSRHRRRRCRTAWGRSLCLGATHLCVAMVVIVAMDAGAVKRSERCPPQGDRCQASDSSSRQTGSANPNSAPPSGRLAAQVRPPIRPTSSRHTNSPIPLPPARFAAEGSR